MVIDRVKSSVCVGYVLMVWAASCTGAAAQTALVDYESSAKAAHARDVAEWRLAFRPPVPVTAQTVAQLRAASSVAPSVLAEADRLTAQASKEAEGDARRSLWHAVALLQGKEWTAQQELLGALALRASSPVATGADDSVSLESLYPTTRVAAGRWHLELFKAEPTSSATPQRGERVASLSQGKLNDRLPQRVSINLSSVPEGAYLLVATVSVGTQVNTELAQSLYFIRNLDARYAGIKARLKKIEGHETAKWIAEYPFALASGLKDGTREIISYDFPQAMARSERIIEALRAGRDEIWQSKGLQARAHALEATGELIPYQLYVPSNWSATRQWPLVVALHGANLDETNMLGRAHAQMQTLAEQSGFIVVAPLGYKLNSWYGSERTLDGGPHRNETPETTRRRHLSEQDVLEVTHLIEKEYGVDPHRRYLTGNSMGGGGTWWIGGHYPQTWAAIAPAAYGGVLPEDVRGLAQVPILAVVGDHDEVGMLPRVRSAIATLQAGGVQPQYIEVAGGTHASAFDSALPRIFEFFRTHTR
jgi:poly(3-hydroxybutyrate) depolymerase